MLLLTVLAAHAATTCMSVADFNSYMQTRPPTDSVVLKFDATGVNPNDWWGTKGALADLTDSTCAAGGSLALKVYGPDDPPNTAHPTGTLKQEYGYNCGPVPNVEHWAEPNASEVIFVDGSERCDVTIWIDPATFGYRLACDHGTWEGSADNAPAMPVNYITVFSLVDGSTWKMPNARSTWNEVCFNSDAPPEEDTGTPEPVVSETISASQDVTVAIDFPTSVFADYNDLVVEAGYSEVYLQFDLSAIPGIITSATLDISAGADGSATGSGTDVYVAANADWSENTLTWNARPGGLGNKLARAAPIESNGSYSLDVSSVMSAPGVYAFALLPAADDTNGSHFVSGEASVAAGPTLHITWEESADTDGGGDGGGDSDGDADDDDANDTGELGGAYIPPAQIDGPSGCSCATGGGVGWLAPLGAVLALRRRIKHG